MIYSFSRIIIFFNIPENEGLIKSLTFFKIHKCQIKYELKKLYITFILTFFIFFLILLFPYVFFWLSVIPRKS